MSWTEYKAVSAQNAAQLTNELTQAARDGWKPILLSAGSPGFIVVVLEHVPGAGQKN